jgi:hypothetical protein
VRVPRERQEALLEEFSRSGLSAAEFSRMAGIKYPTFANWVQKWRQTPGRAVDVPRAGAVGGDGIRLLEAVVEAPIVGVVGNGARLLIELPGGGRLTVHSPAQLAMAAELLSLLAQRSRGC